MTQWDDMGPDDLTAASPEAAGGDVRGAARLFSVIGTDLDAVPVANATERTAPTWEARALAAEARLAALPGEIAAAIRAAAAADGPTFSPLDRAYTSGLIVAANLVEAHVAEAQP